MSKAMPLNACDEAHEIFAYMENENKFKLSLMFVYFFIFALT